MVPELHAHRVPIVAASAFELLSHDRKELPYFNSPVSGSLRSDIVFRFAARKTGEAAAVDIPDPFPPWVANALVPIPITQGLVALGRTSMFTTAVLSLIDGQRSMMLGKQDGAKCDRCAFSCRPLHPLSSARARY